MISYPDHSVRIYQTRLAFCIRYKSFSLPNLLAHIVACFNIASTSILWLLFGWNISGLTIFYKNSPPNNHKNQTIWIFWLLRWFNRAEKNEVKVPWVRLVPHDRVFLFQNHRRKSTSVHRTYVLENSPLKKLNHVVL